MKKRRPGNRVNTPIPRALTDEQVREIKWYLRAGRKGHRLPNGFRQRLAAMFGVSVDLIKSISDRRRYRHVTMKPRKNECALGPAEASSRAAKSAPCGKRPVPRRRSTATAAARKKAPTNRKP